jgi:UDP-N-acetylmuramoyl-L-alanyl-D-glutamate--2,6-diaminopimelate ligase
VADTYCDEIILTNEDPYDEDPEQIICELTGGIMKHKPKVIIDRRQAIHEAIKMANFGDVVLITGKGTDPYLMEAGGKKTPWSDYGVAEEELVKILKHRG